MHQHRSNHPDETGRVSWMPLILLSLAQFMVILDITVVNVALPSIGRDLGFASGDLQWVITAYVLFTGGLLLLGGRMADLLGRRRVFLAGLGLFTIASLSSGLAASPEVLIASRALQGLGAALLSPGRAVDHHDDLRRRAADQGARCLGRARGRRQRPRACCSAAC